jgi:hypothetical protein
MQMPQKFGSASSYGKKYALGNLLLIDDTQDSDATNDHGKSANKVSSKNPLNKGTKEFDAAKKYIAEGNSIDTVKLKYEISSDVEKLLLS